jgi:hypothetical protein
MNITSFFRHAILGITLATLTAYASATVVYTETFGNTDVSNPDQTFIIQPYLTASGVTYSEYSTTSPWTSLYLQQSWMTNQDPGYTFPNIAPDSHLTIARVGGGLAVSGIDTSAFIGQSMTLELSTLIGWRSNNNANGSASLYPYADGSTTVRTMTGNFNDYVKFEMSTDGGLNWTTLTFTLTVAPVDATRPWTSWQADLGTVSSSELQFRLQDTGLLTTTKAYSDTNNGVYTNGILIDSLSLTTAAVPEPATYALGLGACTLLYVTFRRRRSANHNQ